MGRVQNVLRATITQQAFEVVAVVISFVAVPLYLHYLGAERYGLYLTAQAWAGYLSLGNAGISQSTMILVSHASGRGDTHELSRIMRTSIVLSLLAASGVILIAVAALGALQVGDVARVMKLDHPEVPGLLIAIDLQVATAIAVSPFYDLMNGLQRLPRSTALQGINRVVSQLASLALAVRGGTIGQIAGASAIVTVLIGIVVVVENRHVHAEAFGPAKVTRDQVVLQLRTGAKSFGLQIGATLAGTAPTLAIATVAGPASVPLFAVPARLLTVGTGLVSTFPAMLQPAFGEAFARGDLAWIRSALAQVWEKTLLLMGLATALLLAVGGAFILVWTAGKLQVPRAMLGSVAIACGLPIALAPMKFLLSGINRHRGAALIEMINGALAMILAFAAVKELSMHWVGLGLFAASAATSMWMLPAQAKLHLGLAGILPEASRLLRISLCCFAVYGTARLMAQAGDYIAPGHTWASLVLAGLGSIVVSALSVTAFRLVDWRDLYRRFRPQRT